MAKNAVRKIGQLPIETVTPMRMRLTKLQTMELVAEETKNHFVEGFQKGGYQTDASAGGWERRKSRKNDAGRAILVDSGDLWRDIDVQSVTDDIIVVGTKHIPYAARHNEGLKGMVQREFIGPTKALEISNAQVIAREMKQPLIRKVG